MFESFTRSEIKTHGARIVTVRGGNGPPLLLMHGNPFSHCPGQDRPPARRASSRSWRPTCAAMATSKSRRAARIHSGYSFRAMAQDQIEVMAALGFRRVTPPATTAAPACSIAWASTIRTAVAKAAILDIIPQHHLLNNVTRPWGTFFLALVLQHPALRPARTMMGADPDWFIEKKLSKTKQGLASRPAALAEYKRCFRDPATIHAICEDYRATFGVDLAMDTEDSRPDEKSPVRCCCYGARPAASAATTTPWRSGRATPPTSVGGKALPCGHYLRRRRRTRPSANCEFLRRRRAGVSANGEQCSS